MLFNTAKDYDFMPKLTFQSEVDTEDYLEVVESSKLLGVIIRSDMKWCDNVDYMCKKGYMKLWILRWHPGITQKESGQIERVQKCALHIILGDDYQNHCMP